MEFGSTGSSVSAARRAHRAAAGWTARGILTLGALIMFSLLFLFSLSAPFIAGNFLYALAWKYSALLTVPLGLFVAVRLYRSADYRRKMGTRWRFGVFAMPFIIYYMAGLTLLKLPGGILFMLPLAKSTLRVTPRVAPGYYRHCMGEFVLASEEYPGFMQTSLCISGSFAARLGPRDAVLLTGKRGLGGFLVDGYSRIAAHGRPQGREAPASGPG